MDNAYLMNYDIFMKKLLLVISGMCIATFAQAQMINGSFEDWDTSAGYISPVGWDNLNAMTHSTSTITCNRISPGNTGVYSLALNTQNVAGMGVVPGFAVLGKLDSATHLPKTGVPCTTRPEVFGGYWQYMPYTTDDQGYIAVVISKWNTALNKRDTIGYGYHEPVGMVHHWSLFQVGINYTSSATPDSAMVILSASGPNPIAYSFLWVDDVWLGDSVLQTGITTLNTQTAKVALYPNPAKESVSAAYFAQSATELKIEITDITGRTAASQTNKIASGNNNLTISTAGLTKGLYCVKFTDGFTITTQKLIIE